MFYETDKDDHGLRYNPYKSVVVPRPIGWVSTISREGVPNLAPYSQFNNLGYDPPYVMFSAAALPDTGRRKDSVRNATDTGEFVINMATWELRDAVNITSQLVPPDVDEAALAGLEMIPSVLVKPKRVAASPIHLECKLHCVLALPGNDFEGVHHMVVGRVLGVHIKDEVLTADGKIDVLKVRPLARLGYQDYTSVESVFTLLPTGSNVEARMLGLEGRPKKARKAE